MNILTSIKDFFWEDPEETPTDEKKSTVATAEVPSVSALVLSELDQVMKAYSPPIRRESQLTEVMWNAGARQALLQLRERLERAQ